MNTKMQAHTKTTLSQSSFTPVSSGVLQRKCACGNHTMAGGECAECGKTKRFGLQTKLKINEPRDIYEQEADRIADQVMAAPAHHAVSGAPPRIQRFSGQSNGLDTAPASVDRVLSSPGRSLDPALQQDMEQRFGHDFSRVRVHSDAAAEQSARDVNAHAYTMGNDIVFGTGRFAPGMHEGRRLIAHELTHVVQQGSGMRRNVQRAPANCATKKRADVDSEVVTKVSAAATDANNLPDLYLSLKRARACFTDFDETAFLALIAESTKIYTDALRKSAAAGHPKAVTKDDRKLAWAESLKPFAGYLLSGFDTANRLLTGENKKKLGGTMAPSHKTFGEFADKQGESKKHAQVQKAFSEANILVFSGHQYAQYKLPGVWNTGNWDTTLDVRGITGPLTNVKLLISTSCATLCMEAYELWKTIFPNAIFLGAAKSTPLEGSTLANTFVKNLPNDLLFDPGAPGLSSAITAWKSAVEKTQSSEVRGGVLDIPAGTIEFWDGKKWNTIKATDKDNKCKVKGDFSGEVPDPRAAKESE